MVATLMFFDMQSWKDDEKDLAQHRPADGQQRAAARPGPRRAEDPGHPEEDRLPPRRADQGTGEPEQERRCNGASAPAAAQQPGPAAPISRAARSRTARSPANSGPGMVDQKKLQHLAENWGKLPEKERAKAMMEMTKDLPPRYREVIENYFKTLARSQATVSPTCAAPTRVFEGSGALLRRLARRRPQLTWDELHVASNEPFVLAIAGSSPSPPMCRR